MFTAPPGQEVQCPACGFQGGRTPDQASAATAGQEYSPSMAPTPYPPSYPPQGYAYAPPQPTNGLAVTSMVLGIVGLCTIGLFGLGTLLGIGALITGVIGQQQAAQRNEQGRGMAIAGIVLGAVAIAFGIMFLVFWAPLFWW